MPKTAHLHFQQDVARAKAIVGHAEPLPFATLAEASLRSDLLRSAWMFSVGAMDAYFCDAYADLVAATAGSKARQPAITLPEWAYEIKLPLRAVLEDYKNPNWRWRMAARKMMERETVLSLDSARTLFNKFLPPGRKFFRDCLDAWMSRPDAKIRLFGVAPSDYLAMNDMARRTARDGAKSQFDERFRAIIQRRHDCIHNCDRPRRSPQPLRGADVVRRVIQDVEFLVDRCDEHIDAEFPNFLRSTGCSPATIAQTGY